MTEVTDAIVGIIPASDIDEDGQPIDPGFRFSPGSEQITIVVQAGKVTGSPMELTWLQVADDGEHELFAHTVEVASFQTAYSVGTNPGTLTTGTYRVDATFEGETRSTTFDVVDAVESGAASGLLARTGAVAQGDTTGPPASGDSGAVGPRTDPETGFSGQTFLDAWLDYEPVEPNARDIILEINAGVVGGAARAEAYVEMGGNSRTISVPTGDVGILVTQLRFDPCAHPGGSDLPGTTARFVTNLFGEGSDNTLADTVQNDTALGEDHSVPQVTINAQPPAGRVAPGDQIGLDANAVENRDGPTWQTGVKSFRLEAQPGGEIGEEQLSAAGSAQPCDQKQWELDSQATYPVPADAPPTFEICGIADDFAGNEQTKCITFYTREVWQGLVTGEATQPDCAPPTVPITGTIEIVVGEDGTVTGSVTEARVGYSCGGTAVPPYEQTFPITGRKTTEAFELLVSGAPLTLPITGHIATETFDHPGNAGYGTTVTYTAECFGCEL